MDAEPLPVEVGRRMHEVGVEAVLLGKAAPALQGAPVTTVDFDFSFRSTPRNMTKVKAHAEAPRRRAVLRALKTGHERALLDLIRRWQPLPPERRTHFLRKRVGPRGSAA
jgi:hypothetical protein